MDRMMERTVKTNKNPMNFDSRRIYERKTVLITGHTGFKGSWLSIWLKALGANVVGYSLEPNTEPSIFEATNLESKVTHITGDIKDIEHLHEVFKTYKPEFVFHLAAQSLVLISYKQPRLTYETNVIGLINLLEVVRQTHSVKVVLNVTSDKCYEDKEWVWGYRENDPLGGRDPYSSSKACSEIVTSAYRNSFFNPEKIHKHDVAIASARAGNVIGGGDWAQNRIIPDSIQALVQKKPVIIRNQNAIRPWQFVLDPLSGYLWLGAVLRNFRSEFSSAWNFGPDDNKQVTVKELVELMIRKWGDGSWIPQANYCLQPYESSYIKLDCSKAKRLLKWQPLFNIEEAITRTVDWYKSYYMDKNDIYDLCLNQIKEYTTLAQNKNLIWYKSLVFS